MKTAKPPLPEKDLFSASAEESEAENQILAGLNDAQREAVTFKEGPLLIVAGAGTGKTTVLAKRIARLVRSKACLPSEILALTFTDKAAAEMEDRVDRLVPYGFNDVVISTFHSFGDRVIREFAFEIGLSPDMRVLTQPEAAVFLRQHLFELGLKHYLPLTDPTRFVHSLLTAFSRAKDEDVAPPEFLKAAEALFKTAQNKEEQEEAEKHLEVARAYKIYEDLKTKKGFIDFGDQVVICLKILRERPSVLKKYQSKFKYILVDEFQDTNFTQFECIKLLAAPHRNITVVGDDDQSIYKFRGACLSNILGFRKAYPEAHEIVLNDNYRSHQEILDCAYKLIQHNNPDRLEYQDRISKNLKAFKGPGLKVLHKHFDTLFSKCEFVTSEIKKRMDAKQYEPADFAILVRANASAEPFIKSLRLAGIPWRFSGNAGLYEQDEIRLALSFLRSLDDPEDSASLYYLAVSHLYRLEEEDCAKLSAVSSKRNQPLLEVFKDALAGKLEGIELAAESRKKIEKIVTDIKKYRKLTSDMPTGRLLYNFIEESGILKRLAESQDWQAVQEAQNLQRFFEIIKKFGQVCQYDRVHYFIEYLEALRVAGEDPASAEASYDDNAVNILTVHAAKGLEFPVVFMAGLEQGHFPSVSRSDPIELPDPLIKDILPSGSNTHAQEERRLFYVGMTRAKRELFLLSTQDYGKKKTWKTSQFVIEALDKLEVNETALKTDPLGSLKIFAPEAAGIKDMTGVPLPNTLATEDSPMLMSATSIKQYLDCPLQFKFSRVLRIPTLPHHTAVFGTAVHEALKGYNLQRKEGKRIDLETFLQMFRNAWRSEGFVSREHEEQRKAEGIKLLTDFYASEAKSTEVPTLVEEDFRIALKGARIRGRWDRVDVRDKESVVIDYKTGDAKDQKDADKKARESIQLLIYAAAFRQKYGNLPKATVLNFIKSGLVGETVPTDEKVDKALEQAQQVVDNISAQKFEASPGYHCRNCAYEKICAFAQT